MNVETELGRSRTVRKAMSLVKDRKKEVADAIEALGFRVLDPVNQIRHQFQISPGEGREHFRIIYYRSIAASDLSPGVRPIDLSCEEFWHVVTPEEAEDLENGIVYTTSEGEVLWSAGATWYVNLREGSLVELVRAHLEAEKVKLEESLEKIQSLLEGLPS